MSTLRKDRPDELSFYEWSVNRWAMSRTRLALDSSGRGIYRDLLDTCYAQGSIPKDPGLQSKICNCAVSEIERVWFIISRHFYQDKHDPNSLKNAVADVFRKNYFAYLKQQRKNRAHSVPRKSKGIIEKRDGGQTVVGTVPDLTRNDTNEHYTNEHDTKAETDRAAVDRARKENELLMRAADAPSIESWSRTVSAVCAFFPAADGVIIQRIVVEAQSGDPKITDEALAAYLRETKVAGQRSPAFWLKPVKEWAATSALERAKARDPTRSRKFPVEIEQCYIDAAKGLPVMSEVLKNAGSDSKNH